MKKFISRLWKDEEGATMVEYALMLALIAAVCIGTVVRAGQQPPTPPSARSNAAMTPAIRKGRKRVVMGRRRTKGWAA